MPITLSCPACSAGMKVKEQLAGRKVKCPKCAHVLPVPPTETAVEATQTKSPAARAPARATKTPAPPPVRDDDDSDNEGESPATFDELNVPASFREKVEAEIGDESIVWMGRPDPNVMIKKARIGVIVGGLVMLIGLAALASAFIVLDGIMVAVGALFGVVFLLAGIGLILAPVWIKMFVNQRAVYVLTTTRAVIIQKKLGKLEVRTFVPKQLQKTELQVRDGGVGSIVMKYDIVEHSKTSYKGISGATKGKPTNRQGHPVEAEASTSTVRIPIPVGFLDILEVESVDRLLRASLRLPPPAERAPEG